MTSLCVLFSRLVKESSFQSYNENKSSRKISKKNRYTHTHTNIHTYMYAFSCCLHTLCCTGTGYTDTTRYGNVNTTITEHPDICMMWIRQYQKYIIK